MFEITNCSKVWLKTLLFKYYEIKVWFLFKEHKTPLNKVEFFSFLKFYVSCFLIFRKYFFLLLRSN